MNKSISIYEQKKQARDLELYPHSFTILHILVQAP